MLQCYDRIIFSLTVQNVKLALCGKPIPRTPVRNKKFVFRSIFKYFKNLFLPY